MNARTETQGLMIDQHAHHTSEVRDGMRIDWDVPIRMDDGVVLRADVFRLDERILGVGRAGS